MTTPMIMSNDGPQVTVSDVLKNPNRVPRLQLDMMDAQFIGDAILRTGPAATAGAVVWRDPVPLFSEGNGEIVAEAAEIPAGVPTLGAVQTKATTKRALAVEITREMRDRDDMGTLQDRMAQVRNTLVRAWDQVVMDNIFGSTTESTGAGTTANGTPIITSSGSWDSGSSSTIRADIATAMETVMNANYGSDTDNKFGYVPDSLIINTSSMSYFLDSEEVNSVFAGSPLADEQPQYHGKLPRKFFGLTVFPSWQVPDGVALVAQRNVLGFISDERPLQASALYEDQDRETWRSNIVRTSVVGIDNPQAATIITNLHV